MSGEDAQKNKYADYSYAAMSNLVTKADRRTLPKQGEPTGEPESLVGRISLKDMGSRVRPDVSEKPISLPTTRESRKRKQAPSYNFNSILDATSELESISYRPSTIENQEVFASLLALVNNLIGDQASAIIRSASDLILDVLKNPILTDEEKKQEIENAIITGQLNEGDFLRLSQIARKITDYEKTEDTQGLEKDGEMLDEETGVAVMIDEDDEEEVDDESSSDDSEYEEAEIDRAWNQDDEVDEDEQTEARAVDKDKVNASEIDAFWLQRKIASAYPPHVDANIVKDKTKLAFDLLSSPISTGMVDENLMETFEFDKPQLVLTLVKNRAAIVLCTKLARAESDEEKNTLRQQARSNGHSSILDELDGISATTGNIVTTTSGGNAMDIDSNMPQKPTKTVNLEDLAFSQGNHLMSNKRVTLPEGSFKRSHGSYEEIHVPAPAKAAANNDPRVPIDDMPEWTHAAFHGTKELNRVQSKMYDTAFGSDENVLLCAPTGAGKTNVAMLTILHELSKHRNEETGRLRLQDFKIVYVAPLKALVSEMVGNFSSRLASFGISVRELTGDSQLTKQQIAETQIIVTTPEKWDVITRKATDISYTTLVRLLIIDEIHLLHDDRGPVIESIISRVHRNMEQGADPVRLIGLSATLPNYVDVATFLRVNADKGLFYFDQTYRPCPLKQEFIGITEKKHAKVLNVMDTVCYEKVLDTVKRGHQVLVFVHSRRETYRTAKVIRDQALKNDTIQSILNSDAANREILTQEAESVKDAGLKELLPYGFAMHHAGMSKADRTTAEDLFDGRHIRVLVSTATLAWGVNLPAHTVIIKGTQVYSPEKGAFVELSPQDVLQMLGRAGRPQYDVYGEGIIITSQSEMQYYLSLLNQQLPIESQFISRLADNLNAEIVLNTIKSRDDGVEWLGYTYLYIRMLRNPNLYKVGAEYGDDQTLRQKRVDLIHSAATVLAQCNLVKYNIETGALQATELGRIASHYYVSHTSMKTYQTELRPNLTFIELFRVFALSEEFKYIPVREEEKLEMTKILERVPVPVGDSPDKVTCKINVLLQAYISRLKLDGFQLVADMVYVTQSAGRIMRSIFEYCLKRGWSQVARLALDMCKMVERGLWSTRSPLAQFRECTPEILRKLERKEFAWPRYFDLDPADLSELTGDSQSGRLVHRLVHQFPRLQVEASVQPLTRSLLRIELSITPVFDWNDEVHGAAEMFWIIAEDVDGEKVLYHDQFILRKQYAQDVHTVDFTVLISEPLPPHYFVSMVSDRWLHAETKVAISLRNMTLPEKFPAFTDLLDLNSISTEKLENSQYQALFPFANFNKLQTQTFNSLYQDDRNVFIGSPSGSGKTTCALLAFLRHFSKQPEAKALYLSPFQSLIDTKHADWTNTLQSLNLQIVKLTQDNSDNVKLLKDANLIFATSDQWEELSRRWRQRHAIQAISLIIADDLHLLGDERVGANYEIALSRARYISDDTRIVALSSPVTDPQSILFWIGSGKDTSYNFNPKLRLQSLQVEFQSYSVPHFPSLMLAMARPAFLALSSLPAPDQAMIYVANRKQCRDTASDLLSVATAAGEENRFLLVPFEEIAKSVAGLEDQILAEYLKHGIGYTHEALSKHDSKVIDMLYRSQAIQVLLVSRDAAYTVESRASLILVMGTQIYIGREHRYIDYPVSDLLRMLGRHHSNSTDHRKASAIIMTRASKRDYYKKFIDEALPIESQYLSVIHDNFITEINAQTIESKADAVDWMNRTLLYQRLARNPAYYGLEDVSLKNKADVQHKLSVYLSIKVEETWAELEEAKIIDVEEPSGDADEEAMDTVACSTSGMIAAHYAVSWVTMNTFELSLTQKTKLKGLLEIVTAAQEYENVSIRRHEDIVLQRLYDRLPVKLVDINFEDPHHKAFVLVQAHFARMALPSDLRIDQIAILSKIVKLLSACVDVMSSSGFLNTINAMELSQMCVQAQWDRDSPLKQIPYFDDDVIARCKAAGVDEVPQIAELEDEQRDALLQMSPRQLTAVARFCNGYPDIELSHSLDGELSTDSISTLQVQLERTDDEVSAVVAPHYPLTKTEHWWVVLTDATSLLAIKKVVLLQRATIKLEFTPLTVGKQKLILNLVSDSYIGADQEQEIDVVVKQGEEQGEDMDVDE